MEESTLEILRERRERIDEIDSAIVSLLAERFRITNQVGQLKKAHQLSAIDENRERAQFSAIAQLATKAGLDPVFANKFLRCIIDEVAQNHKKL